METTGMTSYAGKNATPWASSLCLRKQLVAMLFLNIRYRQRGAAQASRVYTCAREHEAATGRSHAIITDPFNSQFPLGWSYQRGVLRNSCTDMPTKLPVTEFVCLAVEASTGRQLGRFHRFTLVTPTTSIEGEPPGEVASSGTVNPHTSALPFPAVLDELHRWMASLGLNPGNRNEAGFAEEGNFRWAARRWAAASIL